MLYSMLTASAEQPSVARALKAILVWIAIAVAIALLVGCGVTKPPQPVLVEQERIEVRVPLQLTKPLKPTVPFAKDKYLAMSLEQREDYLTLYIIHLNSVISLGNNRLATIEKLYGEKP